MNWFGNFVQMECNIRHLEKLLLYHEEVIFRRKIFVRKEFHVYIMDKFIQNMDYSQMKH